MRQVSHSVLDAKTKWCPFARVGTESGVNRSPRTNDFGSDAVAKCLASDCMAWRWVETHINDPAGSGMIITGDTYGFCGLAGQP